MPGSVSVVRQPDKRVMLTDAGRLGSRCHFGNQAAWLACSEGENRLPLNIVGEGFAAREIDGASILVQPEISLCGLSQPRDDTMRIPYQEVRCVNQNDWPGFCRDPTPPQDGLSEGLGYGSLFGRIVGDRAISLVGFHQENAGAVSLKTHHSLSTLAGAVQADGVRSQAGCQRFQVQKLFLETIDFQPDLALFLIPEEVEEALVALHPFGLFGDRRSSTPENVGGQANHESGDRQQREVSAVSFSSHPEMNPRWWVPRPDYIVLARGSTESRSQRPPGAGVRSVGGASHVPRFQRSSVPIDPGGQRATTRVAPTALCRRGWNLGTLEPWNRRNPCSLSGGQRAARRQILLRIGGEPVEAPGAAEEEAGAPVLMNMAGAGDLNCHTADGVQRSLQSSGLSRDTLACRVLSPPLEAVGGTP